MTSPLLNMGICEAVQVRIVVFIRFCRGTFLDEARGVLESISNGGSEFSGRHYKSRNIN